METFHPPKDNQKVDNGNVINEYDEISDKWFFEKLDKLIPLIQERWPNIAKQTIEKTKGSIDDLTKVISKHTGKSSEGIKDQLFEIIDSIKEVLKISKLNNLFHFQQENHNESLKSYQNKLYVQAKPIYSLSS